MSSVDINNILGTDLKAVKDLIHNRLYSDVRFLDSINDSLLDHSGKMIRPALCLLMAKACGHSNRETVNFAAAVEMLHNSTLLHDDVADEADTRRGVPTVMSRFGPVPAVLVGDYWLAQAVGLVVDTEHFSWAVGACSKTLADLAKGEMLQQQKAFEADTDEEDYLRIIYCKTASLFELSCQSGAQSVDAPSDRYIAAGEYGKALGLAFQIRDDILDYMGGNLGKPAGLDISERKITLPLLGALKGASNAEEIRRMVKEIPEHPEYRDYISDFVIVNGGVEYAQEVLHDYITTAIEALAVLPESREKELLEQLARHNELRTK